MNRLPPWRIVAAVVILGILAGILGVCAPYYFRNLSLQRYVAALTRSPEERGKPDADVRSLVLQKAEQLGLPITADNVHITRAGDGSVQHIDVRYMVAVDLPGYTVKLHFYPGAGSR